MSAIVKEVISHGMVHEVSALIGDEINCPECKHRRFYDPTDTKVPNDLKFSVNPDTGKKNVFRVTCGPCGCIFKVKHERHSKC